jgi:PBP1b-binding outer membrane lipoprotein LpoB
MEIEVQTPRRKEISMRLLLPLALIAMFLTGCRTNETPRAQVDDLQITAQVKAKLATDVGLSSITDIAINSTNGIVTLSGQVASASVKDQAVAVAKSVPKVVQVIDNIQIAPKSAWEDFRSFHLVPFREVTYVIGLAS